MRDDDSDKVYERVGDKETDGLFSNVLYVAAVLAAALAICTIGAIIYIYIYDLP